jgi:hypothetical protein
VNVLFAAQTKNNDLALLLQRRSLTVSDEPGSLTVIPKAFHEPIISARDEHDPEDTIYRECYEELFGGDEQSTKRHISSRFYLRYCPGVEELFNGKGKNHQLIPLGINWDLLRGNYMLNYCLYVEDPDWWDKYQHEIQVNWEVDSVAEPATLLSEANQIHDLINRQDWAPEAYFAFIEGLRWLAENVPVARNIKASLPNLILTPVS